jgi:hypothetical protein
MKSHPDANFTADRMVPTQRDKCVQIPAGTAMGSDGEENVEDKKILLKLIAK